jgi:hypothetical protein
VHLGIIFIAFFELFIIGFLSGICHFGYCHTHATTNIMQANINSGLLFFEKIIASISRYAVFFYALDHLEYNYNRDFVYYVAGLPLLFILSHMGTDNLITGRKFEGNDSCALYTTRLLGGIVSILIASILFPLFIDPFLLPILIWILLGVAIPMLQINLMTEIEIRKIILLRSTPEILSSSVRFYVVFTGTTSLKILIVSFFLTEIIFGILNTKNAFNLIKKIIILKQQKYAEYVEKIHSDIQNIFWAIFGIACLYLIQKGDIFFLTSVISAIDEKANFLIKSQQFFDMSGIVSISLLPIILKYQSDRRKLLLLSVIISISICLIFYLLVELVKSEIFAASFLQSIFSLHSSYHISLIFLQGFVMYTSMTMLSTREYQGSLGRLLLILASTKIVLLILLILLINNYYLYTIIWQFTLPLIAAIYLLKFDRRPNKTT